MNNERLIHKMGVLGIDHIAVTTDDFLETLREYLSLPCSRLLRGPGWNEKQKVQFAFVKPPESTIIEILGATEGSPIQEHAKRGGGVYHICYLVEDIDRAEQAVKDKKGRIIMEPVPDIAFDERKICFAFHHHLGLFEFVDMLPAILKGPRGADIPERRKIGTTFVPGRQKSSSLTEWKYDQIERKLIELIKKELNVSDDFAARQTRLGSLPAWDSLGHLKLAMAIETDFLISIDSGDLYRLKSYDDILNFLKNKLSGQNS